ncbi:MgtC/SapB transporter [Rhodopirellula maiorica SM1]|uniref:MgtC/SapB transporter n=1 Tax=Rhodopirellula maiorica SM1 TaxID=1265738 RepID=M5RG28_9BACT|nr:MgtC/SapB family protein [Rhodopirellula maiorica]EMI18101.1 MgtC/SapB transporter [Rhodopirellula maiorica SM1]
MEDQINQIIVVLIAGALGAVVGFEREFADKPAGLRTHMFVCAASAMLVLLGDIVLERFNQGNESNISADPIRMIQAIVVGISFLGAGTIIHHRDQRVEGLTTAASILLTSGIGIAVAVGQLYFAAGVTLLAVLVLIIVGWIERCIQRRLGHRDQTPSDPDKTQS